MELKTLPETILHGPRDLDTLIASGNLFEKLPQALKYATNLKTLVLDENPITNLEGDKYVLEKNELNKIVYLLSLNFQCLSWLDKLNIS